MNEHKLRREIVGEMHLRRWPPISPPMTIVQILRLGASEGLPPFRDGPAFAAEPGQRHMQGILADGLLFTWERHSEATTLTVFARPDAPLLGEARAWAESAPGEVLRATLIDIEADAAAAAARMAQFEVDPAELVCCDFGGGARLSSDFRIKDEGYGRLVVAAGQLGPVDLARAVQSLQELGNYRNMALLGLPVARQCWGKLDAAEEELRAFGRRLDSADTSDNELLDALCAMSLELGAIASDSRYRLSATAAYARLVDERLATLAPVAIPGFASLADFTQRRFHPAIRTCETVVRRQQELAERSAQLTSLLRTRIETRIEDQNAQLLKSLESATRTQLRLQHLVEGFSTVAITYYAVSLLAYLSGGLSLFGVHVEHDLFAAMVIVPVFIMLYVYLRRERSRLGGH
ncbi:MAG: DUF3422 domain-containing protein [Novosphingobium sp.]|uniref:DUF3422 domain-containing protein n=1 Tax=Novosphingobium sp. TaxID=1874826 RepID=UPI0030173D28